MIKCAGCWQEESQCICGPFGTSPVKDCWYETSESKDILLNIVKEKFLFGKDGTLYCRKCKNENIACVCMEIDDER